MLRRLLVQTVRCRPYPRPLLAMKRSYQSTDYDSVFLSLPQGQIKGLRRQTLYGDNYYSFEGIPYAKPPVGELRFKAPEPAGPWEDVLDGTVSPNKPLQMNMRTQEIEGSEDCLYINVFTKLKFDGRLPVMVWIYGGGFQTGSASRTHHGPDYLLREDIILVSFNYRLGALGFLSLSDPSLQVPGNAGLKDQVLALQWVHENIIHFNGDCNNITVFGESAGAASVHFLMLTEQTRNLFHKAILMSGCALNYWALMPQTDMAFRLAKSCAYIGEYKQNLVLKYLQQLKPEQLIDHSLLSEEEHKNFYWLTFAPVIEPYESEQCVLSKPPKELLKHTWSNRIPLILGGTSFEGLVMYPRLKTAPQIVDDVIKNPQYILPMEVRNRHNDEEVKIMSEKVMQVYFGDIKTLERNAKFSLLHLVSDKMFWHGLHRTGYARLKYARAPTYLYRFDFDSPTFNHHRNRFCGTDPVRGAAHADDLSYLFLLNESGKLTADSDEYKTIQRMVSMWTAFAKKSNPNCAEIEPLIWKPLAELEPDVGLNISRDIEVMQVSQTPKLQTWDSLYDKNDLY